MSGREAHLAYNFPVAALLLEAAISGRADLLNGWLNRWPALPEATGLFNFTACHDGVGLRALEGLMSDERRLQLLIACEQRGGLISHRRLTNGEEAPTRSTSAGGVPWPMAESIRPICSGPAS
ncbi:MAG: hypothetical protein CM15mP116_08470 [Synechococcus sp.]|nr:MAG: hypothetical protein CM15mP116_08470 [Synechococcus sp.]